MKIVSRLLLCCCVVLCCSLSTATAEELNMNDLIILGLKNNLGLQIEKLQRQQTEAGITTEEAAFDSQLFSSLDIEQSSTPYEGTGFSGEYESDTLQFQAGANKRFFSGLVATTSLISKKTDDDDLSNDLNPRYQTFLQLELTQPLLKGYGRTVNQTGITLAKGQAEQTSLSYLLQAQTLMLQLETMVLQLYADYRISELQRLALQLADDLFDANRKRYSSGLAPITEVQEAETAQADRRLQLSLALQQQELLRQSLNRLLGSPLPGDFNPMSLQLSAPQRPNDTAGISEAELDSVVARRLDAQMVKIGLKMTGVQKSLYVNQLRPQLDLSLRAGVNGLSGTDRGTVPGSAYSGSWSDSLTSMTSADGVQWGAGLTFSLPLGNRAAKARLLQADLEERKQRTQVEDIRLQIEDELNQQQINLARSYEQLQLARDFEAIAEKSLYQEERKLEEGLSDTFRMISFQNKMISAKVNRINAATQYQVAVARMAFLRGEIFERHDIHLTANNQELEIEKL